MMTTVDPWDVASTATVAPRSYYGQLRLDTWFCVLQKGVGKVPFDDGQHSPDDRRTSVDIHLIPIAEQNVAFELKREPIAESREWAGIVLPLAATGRGRCRHDLGSQRDRPAQDERCLGQGRVCRHRPQVSGP